MLTGLSKKSSILIPVVMLGAIGLVALLTSAALKTLNQNNGFDRKYTKTIITQQSIMPHNGIIGISGYTQSHIYFQTLDPSRLIVTDHQLKNQHDVNLNIAKNNKLTSAVYTFVDSPNIGILAGRIPAVIKGETKYLNTSIYKFSSSIFTRGIMISPNSYVIRGFDTSIKRLDQIFMKGNPLTGTIKRENNVSEQRNDAGISTDGTLCYDKKNNLIIYTYYYRNEVICLDTNLNLIRRFNTIDTIANNQIVSDTAGKLVTAATPKRLINQTSDVFGGILFNKSVIKGDNEQTTQFRDISSIDMYDLKTGDYKGSLSIPNYKTEKIQRFKIVENRIIALYKSNIVIYNLF